MKVVSFISGVLITALAFLLWPLGTDSNSIQSPEPAGIGPVDVIDEGSHQASPIPAQSYVEPAGNRRLVGLSEEEAKNLEEEIRRETVEEIAAMLGADWITPIKPPAVGEGPMLGGVRHGEWSVFHPARALTDRGRFVLGSKEGEWRVYNTNNELIKVRTFVRGKVEGTFKQRASASDPWESYEFRNGERVE